jgi:hypothetical protein
MVLLRLYGEIEETIISKELAIKICNLSNEVEIRELQQAIENECCLREHLLEENKKWGISCKGIEALNPDDLVKKLGWNEAGVPSYKIIAEHVIEIQAIDCDESELRNKNECTCNPSCEMEYAERFMHFCKELKFSRPFPGILYTSNDYIGDKPHILDYMKYDLEHKGNESDSELKLSIQELVKIGADIDRFLQDSRGNRSLEDFWLFDYIVDALMYLNRRGTAYHIFKLMSLIEMLIIKPNGSGKTVGQMETKLPLFLPKEMVPETKCIEFSTMMRRLRNKIAHGNVSEVLRILQEYRDMFPASRCDNRSASYLYIDEYSVDTKTYFDIGYILECALSRILQLMIRDKLAWKNLKNKE